MDVLGFGVSVGGMAGVKQDAAPAMRQAPRRPPPYRCRLNAMMAAPTALEAWEYGVPVPISSSANAY